MALRNQPYLPLYVQDFLTDEKLNECSAESTGVYIRLLCIMHKSEEYGTILLKQKDQQTTQQIENFAIKLAKHMPYTIDVIHKSLHELLTEGVIKVDSCKLLQKRMIHDNLVSIERENAGRKGGFATAKKIAKATAKEAANSEYENEYENEDEYKDEYKDKGIVKGIIDDLNEVLGTSYKHNSQKTKETITARLNEGFTIEDFKTVHRKMLKAWGADDKMVKYLRPITLYSNKFESYLNMRETTTKLTENGVKAYLIGQSWLSKEAIDVG